MFTAGTSQSRLAILSQLLGRGTDRNVRFLRFSGRPWSLESHPLPIPFNTRRLDPSQTITESAPGPEVLRMPAETPGLQAIRDLSENRLGNGEPGDIPPVV